MTQQNNVTAPFGSNEYMQQALYSLKYSNSEKLSLIYRLDQSIEANLQKALDKIYANQAITKRDKTSDDELFIEQAIKTKNELIRKLKDQVFNNKERDSKFNNLPSDEISALFALASIKDLDNLLDSSNGFITGLEDGGDHNINSNSAREAAIADIVTRFNQGSNNYQTTLSL